MIASLTLTGLGVIDRAEVSFGPGLTVLTGETGAGKTMVLTGLNLLLGGRADPAAVRRGSERAEVEGTWRIVGAESDHDVRQRISTILDEVGGAWDDDELIVVRTVPTTGASRAYLGGRRVPSSVLAGMAEDLVAVHGQDDVTSLTSPARQRMLLDRYAGAPMSAALAEVRAGVDELLDLIARRREISERTVERAREAALLGDLLEAVEAVDPQPGEDDVLAGEIARLAHAERIGEAVDSAHRLVAGADGGGPGAAELLARAEHEVRRASDLDPSLTRVADALASLGAEAAEIAIDLARERTGIAADPQRLTALEQRRADLAGLRRRLAVVTGAPLADADAIGDWAQQAARRHAELADDDTAVEALDAAISEQRGRVAVAAGTVRTLRLEAAEALASAVNDELAGLAMSRARFHVDVALRSAGSSNLDGAEPWVEMGGTRVAIDRTGVDDVAFALASSPNDDPRPLGRGASGGERSRIMLALEVALAAADPVPTMVFDEVDAGVGGKAAVEVGRRLARLARTTQVIVVTHLPQVAAFADRHLVVRPHADGSIRAASVEHVEGPERARELARMLAGQEDSATAQLHAEELLALATSDATGDTTSDAADDATGDAAGDPAPTASAARRLSAARARRAR